MNMAKSLTKVNTSEKRDENSASEVDDLKLDASSTDSDSDDDINDEQKQEQEASNDPIRVKILNKYKEIKGKQLYVRFPKVLPLDLPSFQKQAMALSPLIVKAHKPRQKHANFCLVDFKTKEDRDKVLKELKVAANKDAKFKGIVASIPKTESDDFINGLIERKKISLANKKAKIQMKRAVKMSKKSENHTTSIVITNLPKTATVLELRELFSNAVDIQIKAGKGKSRDTSFATITLPSTLDARKATNKMYSLSGTKLIIKFNTREQKKLNLIKKKEIHIQKNAKHEKSDEQSVVFKRKTHQTDKSSEPLSSAQKGAPIGAKAKLEIKEKHKTKRVKL